MIFASIAKNGRMQFRTLCTLFIGFLLMLPLFGQDDLPIYDNLHCVRALKDSNSFNHRTVFLQVKVVDSTKQHVIFLINRSLDTITTYSYECKLSVYAEAKDRDGNWKRIDRIKTRGCYHVYSGIRMHPNSYLYVKKKFPNLGNFDTELRYRVVYGGDSLISKPIPVTIWEDQFLLEEHGYLEAINQQIYRTESEEHLIPIVLIKVQFLAFKLDRLEEAMELITDLEKRYGAKDNILFTKGHLYLKYYELLKDQIGLKHGIASAAFELWNSLKLDEKQLESKKVYEFWYEKILPTQQELLTSELECKELDNGAIQCFVPHFVNKWVQMRFKE